MVTAGEVLFSDEGARGRRGSRHPRNSKARSPAVGGCTPASHRRRWGVSLQSGVVRRAGNARVPRVGGRAGAGGDGRRGGRTTGAGGQETDPGAAGEAQGAGPVGEGGDRPGGGREAGRGGRGRREDTCD